MAGPREPAAQLWDLALGVTEGCPKRCVFRVFLS